MKGLTFIVTLLAVGILVFSVIIQTYAASPPEINRGRTSLEYQAEISYTEEVIQSGDTNALVTCAYAKIAPVFDDTGAVVSDPTGAVLNANELKNMADLVKCPNAKIAPVFDATGAVVSDPTGAILSPINP